VHIGLVIYGSLDTLSGGYLYDRVLVEHLQRSGDRVEIVSLPWRNYAAYLTDNLSVALHKRLREAHFDVLIQDELNHPSLFELNHHLRRHVRYPILAIVHHLRSSELRPAWQNALYRRIERRYLSSLDGFIFNSQTTRGVVEGLVGASRPHVVAYPAGNRLGEALDDSRIEARAHEPGPLRALFLGNVIPRKGLHVVLDALARLPEDQWTLTVVGDLRLNPAYGHAIQRQMRVSGLGGRVHLVGPMSGDRLREVMVRSHVMTMPSSYEGFGIAYLEGMAFGLPAIASTVGAAHEIITHGVDGFLIPPEDSRTLAQCLHLLSQDRERLVVMGLAARQRFARHPTWQQTAERIQEFVHAMVDRTQAGWAKQGSIR